MSIEPALAALAVIPRNVAVRGVVALGLVLPWVWLVMVDRALRRRR